MARGSPVAEVEPEEAHDLHEEGEAVIVDVRRPGERASVRIPRSEHIPMSKLPDRMSEIPTDRTVVFQCARGGRSARACSFFASWDDVDAVNLAGGIEAWEAADLPVERG